MHAPEPTQSSARAHPSSYSLGVALGTNICCITKTEKLIGGKVGHLLFSQIRLDTTEAVICARDFTPSFA